MRGLILLIVMFGFSFNAQALSVQQLNLKIQKNNLNWKAKQSWLNNLSHGDLIKMMGARGVHPKGIDFSTNLYSSTDQERFDWRDHNGHNYVTPILNQGNCGSCVAFAAVATLETQMNISSAIPSLNPKYSTQSLFACGGGRCNQGWWPVSAAYYLKRTGVPDEACAPYTMGATGEDVRCSDKCNDSAHRSQKIQDYNSPYGTESVKRALKRGPMMTTMYVYEDFISYSEGVYKHVEGRGLGGHAVSLIGYDDSKQAWIIRNSWGKAWGMNGFAYISYDDVSGISEENHSFYIKPKTDYLFSDLQNRSFVSNTVDLKVTSRSSSKGPINLSLKDASGNALQAQEICQTSSCTLKINTRSLDDGKYTLVAKKAEASLHRYFYISNHSHKYDVKIQALGFNPEMPVDGRIEFAVDIASESSVPFNKVAFVYMNEDEKLTQRWTKNIANTMSMGWRTPVVENGTYRVWVKAEAVFNGQSKIYESNRLQIKVDN